jgi:WD40 repeat protein
MATSLDGQFFAIGSAKSVKVHKFEIPNFRFVESFLNVHKGDASQTAMIFSSDSKMVFTAATDGRIRVCGVSNGTVEDHDSLESHTGSPINSMCISPNGFYLAFGDDRGDLQVVSLRTFKIQFFVENIFESRVQHLAFDVNNKHILSISKHGELKEFEILLPKEQLVLHDQKKRDTDGETTNLMVHRVLPYVITSNEDRSLKFWDHKTMLLDHVIEDCHSYPITTFAMSKPRKPSPFSLDVENSYWVASGDEKGNIAIHMIDT